VSRISLAFSTNPFLPYFMRAAQVPAMTEPGREPAIVGVTYIPPGQFETAQKDNLLNSVFLKRTTERPLGP
jgi:hypothetical protein